MKKLFIAFFSILVLSSTTVQAQKYAIIDTRYILDKSNWIMWRKAGRKILIADKLT